MRTTYMTEKSFRYRNGSESNRRVLVTSQNQNTLRGFDVTNMSEKRIQTIMSSWTKIQGKNMPLTAKESYVLSNTPTAKGSFKSFMIGKIRYFHSAS